MKLTRSFLATNLTYTLVLISCLTIIMPTVLAQDSTIALQRGFRTGYSDGYMSGYRDKIENATKSYARHPEYKSADRAFNTDYGKLTDYRDGYKQGFEKGYETGFSKQSFDATIPVDIGFRGDAAADPPTTPNQVVTTPKTTVADNVAVDTSDSQEIPEKPEIPTKPVEEIVNVSATATTTTPGIEPLQPDESAVSQTLPAETDLSSTVPTDDDSKDETPAQPSLISKSDPVSSLASGDEIIVIPADTELIIELIDRIDTQRAREGDTFTAKVTSPYEISGAIIEGRIAKNRRPGRLKRRAELLLSFDRIKLSETRWSNFNAIIVEVLPVKGDNVKRVDDEGVVAGQRPYKKDVTTIGASTGAGVVIGAVVGGPVGAAVGAGVGAAFGVGAVVVERGKWIVLTEQQQMRIRTAYETQIR